MTMVTVFKSALKARMHEYLRQVEATGEPLVVTHRGKSVLQVLPMPHKRPAAELLAEFRARAYDRRVEELVATHTSSLSPLIKAQSSECGVVPPFTPRDARRTCRTVVRWKRAPSSPREPGP